MCVVRSDFDSMENRPEREPIRRIYSRKNVLFFVFFFFLFFVEAD